MSENTNDEKIVDMGDDAELSDFNSAGGGIVRPGGENKGRKSNEYWGEVEKELLKQAKELQKLKAEPLKTIPAKGNPHGPRL